MAHAQKPDFVSGETDESIYLGGGGGEGGQFSPLLAAEVCASAVVIVVMLDTPYSEAV